MYDNLIENVEAFDDAIFYYSFDTFYVKADPNNDDYSFVIVKNEDGKFLFHVSNECLEQRIDLYDLRVVRLRNYKE